MATGPVKHGDARRSNGRWAVTPEYRSWRMMRSRCLNPRNKDWRYYGGRGIGICQHWDQYKNFLADMGRRPSPLHTLDRIDGNQNYSKENCRWATRQQQARNRAWIKLDPQTVSQIKTIYAAGGVRQVDLARRFGVIPAHISRIIRGVAWVAP